LGRVRSDPSNLTRYNQTWPTAADVTESTQLSWVDSRVDSASALSPTQFCNSVQSS